MFLWTIDTNYKLKVENQTNLNFRNIFYNRINVRYTINSFPKSFYVKLSFKAKCLISYNSVNFLMESIDLVDE